MRSVPAVLSFVLACGLCACVGAGAKPFIPGSDGEVLERLPERGDPSLRVQKRLQQALARRPRDLSLATLVARNAIAAARASGDPRFLGHAEAALQPWWADRDPPPEVLLLRATIRQSNHDFAGALADLDRLLQAHPNDGQALLTRATIHAVQGRYDAARTDCARLAPLTIPLVAAACKAGPASQTGAAAAAYADLVRALDAAPRAAPAVRAWAWTLAAEIAARRGEGSAAEQHYRDALAIDARDPYLLASFADFLLAERRPAEVVPMLAPHLANDSLLLRNVLALQRLPEAAEAFTAQRRDLAERFAAAARRGDSLHRREEARFRLCIEHDARGALALARANWGVQREPADLAVLALAADATRDAATLAEVETWRRAHPGAMDARHQEAVR